MPVTGNEDQPGHHLVLGGGGFIGRHVAVLLARSGRRVVVADRVPGRLDFPPDVAGLLSVVPFDLATADWDALLAGVAVVHHYAWGTIPATADADPPGDVAAHLLPTLALLEAVRRRAVRPVVVFASSGGTVYGRLRHVPVQEDHPLAPITAYGAGKAAAELYLGGYRSIEGIDCRVARLANPFGAGQNFVRGQGAATAFLGAALAGRPITIWGDGEVVRDYVHISDAAAGLVALALAPSLPGPWIFNVGSGHGVSLNGIVAELETRLGRTLQVTHAGARAFDVPVSILDVTLARSTLGWVPLLSFSDGMARMLLDVCGGREFSTLDRHAGTTWTAPRRAAHKLEVCAKRDA